MTETKRRPGGADLRELVDFEGTCLTIYLSGHKAGSGSGSQRMRLLAKLSEAERELATRGVTAATADALVEPLRELVDDPDLGYGHDDSLAIFRSSRQLKQWRLPWNVEDELSVGAYPLLMPIASGLHANPDFLILALSRQNTRMLRCGPGFQHAVEWPMDLPRGLREFEGFDRPDHARAQTGAGVKFGLDTFAEKQPQYLHDFFRALERGLHPMLKREGLPLVPAGAAAELAAYRSISGYPLLAPQSIAGSPDGGCTDAELAEKGRAAMQGWRSPEALQAAESYLRAGPGLRSAELEEIIRPAKDGRVMHLYLAGGLREDRELANAAAVETWRHGGNVWIADEPLDGSSVAARFRW